jgi:cobalt-zinc-cadmium efflux system outer membrane protein
MSGKARLSATWALRQLLAAAALALAQPLVALAAEQEPHAHVPIVIDATLDWNELIDATLNAHPRRTELAARADEAAAWSERGHNWLAAAPALYFSYLSDSALDDFGQLEYEGGVELPIWRGGQRNAVQALAQSNAAASSAAAAALRLEAVGLLRGALWDIEAAANGLAAANDTIAAAEELLRVVELRNARGDLSRGDVLLARAALLERRQAAVAVAARLVDAERAYFALTGLDRRPARFAEQPSERDELGPNHPLLALAEAEVMRAEGQAALVGREAVGNIAVTIGPRREYAAFNDVPTDSVSVGVRVPVGGERRGSAVRATAARFAAAAAAERGLLMRRLDLDLHEAEHALTVLEESTALASERRELAAQQARMAQTAFAQGEVELRELLRIQESEQAAIRDVQRLTIERQRTIAALNQALGETP